LLICHSSLKNSVHPTIRSSKDAFCTPLIHGQKERLIEAIGLTPFSREEFSLACQPHTGALSDLERARHFFIRARQVRTGLAQKASLGRWANCKNTSRAGMSGVVSRWLGSVEGLPAIAERLLRVQIENRPALEVIDLYDAPGTLFYCDPPYPHESRGDVQSYGFEMTDAQHRQFARRLRSIDGKAAVSAYHCPFYDQLFAGWRRVEAPVKQCHSIKKPRQEVLWMDY
jgi:DNA adenine methylase